MEEGDDTNRKPVLERSVHSVEEMRRQASSNTLNYRPGWVRWRTKLTWTGNNCMDLCHRVFRVVHVRDTISWFTAEVTYFPQDPCDDLGRNIVVAHRFKRFHYKLSAPNSY